MKNRIIIYILLCFQFYSFSIFASEFEQSTPSNKCQLTRSEVLTDIYEQVTLKVADFLASENVASLEDYSNIIGRNLSKKNEQDFRKSFEKYGKTDQFSYFINSLDNLSYWSKSKRLGNGQAALVILLINERYELNFTSEEIEVIWFMQLINDLLIDKRGKFSSAYNQFNLSNQIIKLTGAMKSSRPLAENEAKSILRKITHINCYEDYNDFLALEVKDLFLKVIAEKQLLTYVNGTIFFGKKRLLDPTEITVLKGNITGAFDDDRNLIEGPTSYNRYINKSIKLNTRNNLSTIKGYYKNFLNTEFAVVDKKEKIISLYDENGEFQESSTIEIGSSDKLNHSGAGIYQVNDSDNDMLTLTAEKNRKTETYQTNLNLPAGTKVYILPTEEGNKFVIKNYKLNFISNVKREHYAAYNFSSRDRRIINTEFSIQNSKSEFIDNYLTTLSDEKEKLMKIYNMDSETYNQLALFAFGVLAPESRFGKDLKYKIKEIVPFAISLAKGNWFNTNANSRGPTQIKRIPNKVIEEYGIRKSDLKYADASAIATLGFAHGLLIELKAIAKKHPNINRDNIYDYLYYLYNGKRYEIVKATATPDKNIAIKRIKEAIKLVRVSDTI